MTLVMHFNQLEVCMSHANNTPIMQSGYYVVGVTLYRSQEPRSNVTANNPLMCFHFKSMLVFVDLEIQLRQKNTLILIFIILNTDF